MVDLAPHSPVPMWRNGRGGIEGINKRLDRFLAIVRLLPILNRFRTWTHPFVISYHYPVCLEWDVLSSSHLYPFKFNQSWLLEKDFPMVVNTSWALDTSLPTLDHMSLLNHKLKMPKSVAKIWEKRNCSLGIKRLLILTWRSNLSLLLDPLVYFLTVKLQNCHLLKA